MYRLINHKKASRRQTITVVLVQVGVLILTYVIIGLIWGMADSAPSETPASTLEQISIVPILLSYVSACVGIGYGAAWFSRKNQSNSK